MDYTEENNLSVPPDDGEPSEAPAPKRKGRGGLSADIFEWADSIISAIIAIILVFTFVVRVTSVDGGSMYPTLQNEDRMLVTNFFYTPKHNDIVVVYADNLWDYDGDRMGKPIIKRVIGVSGDEILYDTEKGEIYRNGELLAISQDDGGIYEDGHLINERTYFSVDFPANTIIKVGEGRVLVMGDNRGNSVDSRYSGEWRKEEYEGRVYVGMVDVNNVVGRAFFRVSPFERFGFVK
ncbi:MAG: signal peptidase I [Oscillospiraceae bacterium]|jgi:signal peptidase I|nr:signal peptidase I [Oscillospiraceae bacterium]